MSALTRRAALAAVTAVATFVAALPAAADHHTFDCGFEAVRQEAVTGAERQGYAYGFVVGDADDELSITCEVRVDHITVASTPPGTGTAAALTAGTVTFAAEVGDVVELCALVTLDGTPTDYCHYVAWGPPDDWSAFYPLLDLALELVGEFLGDNCPVLAALAGSYGPLVVDWDGDVYLAGERYWDCPPYDASGDHPY